MDEAGVVSWVAYLFAAMLLAAMVGWAIEELGRVLRRRARRRARQRAWQEHQAWLDSTLGHGDAPHTIRGRSS